MPQTIQITLDNAKRELQNHGIRSFSLDAELLLAHILGSSKEFLLANNHQSLDQQLIENYRQLISARAKNKPIPYILNHKDFFNLSFYVDERVLIPRQETEFLIEQVLAINSPPRSIADICTGSGCIAITLARYLPQSQVYATDISPDALEVARINFGKHNVTNIDLLCGNLLDPLPEPVDLIVCNPPYIPTTDIEDLEDNVKKYEPRQALSGGPDGLRYYREILATAADHLNPHGQIILEIGAGQSNCLARLVRTYLPDANFEVISDLASHDRIIHIRT